jgi:putative membrane protein
MSTAALWSLLAIFAAARVLQAYPSRFAMVLIMALHVLPPLAFALIHGAKAYNLRAILMFVLICFVVGNTSENLSIATGFPFGHYHFTDVMGPKLFRVPILLGLAYIGMGYLSWTLGRVILGGIRVVALPLFAAFIMLAWDLSMDPIWSNFVHGWVWHDGGAYFGVPLSNFFGWYLTVYLIYQLFALYLTRTQQTASIQPASSWRLAVLFYAVCAAGNLLVAGPQGVTVIVDAVGTPWQVSAILSTSALISVVVMGSFALLAWLRTFPAGRQAQWIDKLLRHSTGLRVEY